MAERARTRDSKAVETYAALTAHMGEGLRLADAIRAYAKTSGRSEAAIRASYYAQRVKLGHRGRQTDGVSADQAVDEARRLLELALDRLEGELASAQAEHKAAAANYEQTRARVDAERVRLEHTLAALAESS